MSWSDRITRRHLLLPLVAAGLVGACGFTPAYGPDGGARALRDRTLVEAPDTVDGYRLRQHMQDRLGSSANPAYILSLTIDIRPVAAATAADGTVTRQSLPGIATYALRAAGSETVLTQGSVDSFTAWSTTGSTVAVRQAQDDAADRLTRILADLVMARLLIVAEGL